jgi:hypothetical protein
MRFWPVFLTCPFLAGCVGFGYPDISRTPAVAVPTTEVRAFRVISDFTLSGPVITGPIHFINSVEEIPVVNGTVGPQRDAYFAYYYLVFPLGGYRSRTLEVLLYRPGYETVEIPARRWWQSGSSNVPEKVAWKEAQDLLAQKAAVDRIASREHFSVPSKDVLRFAAREYARLADSPMAAAPAMSDTREELQRLGRECHDLAEKEDR